MDFDKGQAYKFYINMIEFMADICKDRNYMAIESLNTKFSYEICWTIVSNPEYTFELRNVFLKLIITLWIDRSPFHKIILPNSNQIL